MLGLLLESNARRVRRTGGATMSVALHFTIIGLVTAGTARLPHRDRPEPVRMIKLPPLTLEPRAVTNTVEALPHALRAVDPLRLINVIAIPTQLPPIVLPDSRVRDPGAGLIDFAIGRGFSSQVQGIVGGGDAKDGTAGTWGTAETLMRVVTLARPRYPDALRSAGVSGAVLLQFVVDTTGRVDLSSVTTLRSTHELFTRAVLDVLPQLRFRPTEANGRRVRALAEMPFEFVIR